MRLRPCAPLVSFIIVTAAPPAALGLEVHAEHEAEHTTTLRRQTRPRRPRAAGAGLVRVEITPHGQALANVTTPLEDMSSEYTGAVGVGEASDGGPQFEAHVVFDTGSTNLWVASVLCTDALLCGHPQPP
mmetsp:Transcript_9618/g.21175  ORF Transcript_9618/g.21175 Transcript_9618/m.21175 type:complete len:130 (-) Transcript_9618:488-877(-)